MGHKPFVCVWAPRTVKQLQRLDFPEVRGVAAVAFTPDGKRLLTACMDNRATIYVWAWEKGAVLAEVTGGNSVPPLVWGLVPHPTNDEFISYGRVARARVEYHFTPSRLSIPVSFRHNAATRAAAPEFLLQIKDSRSPKH